MNWNDIPSYRKKPNRFKAIQYLENDQLPTDAVHVDDKGRSWCAGKKIRYGDWIVLDLMTSRISVVPDDIFNLVFEGD
jgi:hypothetical protein